MLRLEQAVVSSPWLRDTYPVADLLPSLVRSGENRKKVRRFVVRASDSLMGRAKAACTGKAGKKKEFITASHWWANVLLLLGKEDLSFS